MAGPPLENSCQAPTLLQALRAELLGAGAASPGPLADWARAVVNVLCGENQGPMLKAEEVLDEVSRALGSIMVSPNRGFLLADALRRPEIFARTVILMMKARKMPVWQGRGEALGRR